MRSEEVKYNSLQISTMEARERSVSLKFWGGAPGIRLNKYQNLFRLGGEGNFHHSGISPRLCLSQTIHCFSNFRWVFGTPTSQFLLQVIYLSTVSHLTQEHCNTILQLLQTLLGLEQNNGKFSHKNLRNATTHIILGQCQKLFYLICRKYTSHPFSLKHVNF